LALVRKDDDITSEISRLNIEREKIFESDKRVNNWIISAEIGGLVTMEVDINRIRS
jgi:hypothetical protein